MKMKIVNKNEVIIDKKTYVATKSKIHDCTDCDLNDKCILPNIDGCSPIQRHDGRNIVWKLKKDNMKYPINKILYHDLVTIIVNFTEHEVGTVVFTSNKNEHQVGFYSRDWNEASFNELTKEEEEKYMKTKYKTLKTISGEEIAKYEPRKKEFEKYLKEFGFFATREWTISLEDYMIIQNGWIEFLIKHGFIEKNKIERPKFEVEAVYIIVDVYTEKYYKLQYSNSFFTTISLQDGDSYFSSHTDFSHLIDMIEEDSDLNIYKCSDVEEFYKLKELNQLERVRLEF